MDKNSLVLQQHDKASCSDGISCMVSTFDCFFFLSDMQYLLRPGAGFFLTALNSEKIN